MIALSAQALKVAITGVPVIDALDVAFNQGCWTAIVGPNGAGKSTLLKALAGLIPSAGEVHLLGQSLQTIPLKKRAQQLAWLGQEASIGGEALSVYDTVMLGRLPYQGWLSAPSQLDHEVVAHALLQTQAWDWRERSVNALSGGERQRVLLARVLAVQAGVVLMDEPLANVDPPHQADWVNTVSALTREGTTVVSVLHEINVALMADFLLVMDAGKVLHHGLCTDTNTHRAIETVFNQRLVVHQSENGFFANLQR